MGDFQKPETENDRGIAVTYGTYLPTDPVWHIEPCAHDKSRSLEDSVSV